MCKFMQDRQLDEMRAAGGRASSEPLGREAMLSGMLRKRGIHPTQQRLRIAAILLSRRQHCSADELLGMVNADGAIVSKATVYNTLRLFAERALVREVLVDPTKVFYDSNTEPHQHFYDVDTGELTDVPMTEGLAQRLPSVPRGTRVVGVDVVIRVRSRPARGR